MKENLPVTQTEFPFPDGAMLVSTTDLQSRIMYCNPAFVMVSGYSEEELIGQPHNVIRHPDMPAEAFRDMWETIRSGSPWSAVVKNRRKNGDHYWVVANVTPLMEHNQPVGFMSVRTKPTRQQITEAEALYRQMSREHHAGRTTTRLRFGRCVLQSPAHRIRSFTKNLFGGATGTGMVFLVGLSMALGATLSSGSGTAVAVGLAAAVVIGRIASWWSLRAVTSPIQEAVSVANRIAAGDLSKRAVTARTDAIGQLFSALNQLNVNLQAMVLDVRAESERIDTTSNEIASSSMDLSSRTEGQASSLQQTAASVEQITATVKHSSDSSNKASELASEASRVATRGGSVVLEVVQTMESIRNASVKIEDITSVIDGIAFQTNILALNAAVEAARAGEQGRGFAVVASEVRGLAQRSAVAAKEIKSLISESAIRVHSGTVLVENAGATMTEVITAVRQVSDLIEGISVATSEQTAGIQQVNEAVTHLDTVTQKNAAMVEESAAMGLRLKNQAQSLAKAVQIFKLTGQPT